MSYIINKSNGSTLVTPTMPSGVLLDGTADTSTGLTLIGRNYTGFGEVQNENFVKLLENFSADTPPTTSVNAALPLIGTLWWDSGNNLLKAYDGYTFIQVNGRLVANTAPIAKNIGDEWWDTINAQIKIWNGTSWFVIGPSTTAAQGRSGTIVESITDTSSVPQLVVSHYSNGNLISISSNVSFTPNVAITGFSTINKGVNIPSNSKFSGTATNSETVGDLSPTVFARQDRNQTFAGDVGVTGNLAFSNANISVANSSLVAQNKNLSGNIEIYSNLPTIGNTKTFTIVGSSGLGYVYGDPVSAKGISTKGYVDTTLADALATIGATSSAQTALVTQLRLDTFSNIANVIVSTNANLVSVSTGINSNVANLSTNLTTISASLTANMASVIQQVGYVNAALPLLAPVTDPTFIGTVQVPLANPSSNNSIASSTQYVDTRAFIMQRDYTTLITNLTNSTATNLYNATVIKANIIAPAFQVSGNTYPTSVTPEAGDNSSKIATTAFISSAITSNKFNYTVATGTPGQTSSIIFSTNNNASNDGDFWFTIG